MNFTALLCAVPFAAMVGSAIKTGKAPLRRPLRVRRESQPLVFWLVVALYSVVALSLVWLAFQEPLSWP